MNNTLLKQKHTQSCTILNLLFSDNALWKQFAHMPPNCRPTRPVYKL